MDTATALDLALGLADRADVITTARFRAHDLHVTTKPDLTPVSEADQAVERAIRDALAAFPDHAVLGEEYGHDPGADAGASHRWIIDPIDGTNEFAEPPRFDWAIHVALWERGVLTAAAVSMPALDIVFSTDPPPVVPTIERERPILVTSRSRNSYSAVRVANELRCDV
ncbi:MAG: inositol monophosphatase family protein, partial [Actinomycetota bacterium]